VRVFCALLALPAGAGAQRAQPELRVDAIGTSPMVVHVGGGLTWALGNYARLGVVGSYGRDPKSTAHEWRGDILGRVVLDPFRRHRFGLSLGGGLTWRDRPYLLALAEIEGPLHRGTTLAAQVGLGGGPRLGLIVRRGYSERR
jgi:hypothetical protein